MQQLDLRPQLYDVNTDMMRAARQNDIDNLQAVYWAYGQVRMATLQARNEGQPLPVIVLDTIHTELKRRLHVPS